MPSQEYAPPEYTSLSPSESGNVNKRKAPEDNFAEEVFCPCSVGPCIVLTSAKPHSQGRKFYRCPKSKEDGQCGFFQWQDEPPRKQQVQANFHTGKQQNFTSEADGMVPQKPECRCGLEAIEITSNSAANPGRVFYKCPKNEAEGRCKFFKWQDELQNNPPKQPAPMSGSQATHQPASTKQAAPSGAAGGSGVFADGDDDFDDNFGLDEALNGATAGKAHAAPHSYAPSSMHQGFDGQQNVAQQQGFAGHQANGAPPTSPGAQPPEILNCDCGLQCSYIMAKTAKNDGRWFYRCPKPKEEGQCRFFQWADELGQQPQSTGKGGGYAKPGAAYGDPAPAPGYHTYSSPTKMAAAPAASNDACFKCGQTGHWSRDCPSGGGGGGAAGGGSCFKCGQEGHWARDCPNPSSGARPGGGTGRAGGGGGRGPGYGGGGRGSGGAQGYGASHGGGTAAASGACYKCGQSGHWTNSCPN